MSMSRDYRESWTRWRSQLSFKSGIGGRYERIRVGEFQEAVLSRTRETGSLGLLCTFVLDLAEEARSGFPI
jgi:hypothetical protein